LKRTSPALLEKEFSILNLVGQGEKIGERGKLNQPN